MAYEVYCVFWAKPEMVTLGVWGDDCAVTAPVADTTPLDTLPACTQYDDHDHGLCDDRYHSTQACTYVQCEQDRYRTRISVAVGAAAPEGSTI